MSSSSDRRHLRLKDLSGSVAHAGGCIGRGAFSDVLAMQVVDSSEMVAVKRISRARVSDPSLVLNEKAILLGLEHRAMVKLYGLGTDKDQEYLYFFFEYCPNGTVAGLIESHAAGFDLNTIRIWACQVLIGLRYLHEHHRIVHGDIKPANLLLDQKCNVKIADFGFARSVRDLNRTDGTLGTKIYWAPELIQKFTENRDVDVGEKIDIWAFGITFYQIAFLDHPFRAANDTELERRVFQDEVQFPTGADPDLATLLTAALTKPITGRPTVAQLLQFTMLHGLDQDTVFDSDCCVLNKDDGALEASSSLFDSF